MRKEGTGKSEKRDRTPIRGSTWLSGQLFLSGNVKVTDVKKRGQKKGHTSVTGGERTRTQPKKKRTREHEELEKSNNYI